LLLVPVAQQKHRDQILQRFLMLQLVAVMVAVQPVAQAPMADLVAVLADLVAQVLHYNQLV
jgi:hypothetical protein